MEETKTNGNGKKVSVSNIIVTSVVAIIIAALMFSINLGNKAYDSSAENRTEIREFKAQVLEYMRSNTDTLKEIKQDVKDIKNARNK